MGNLGTGICETASGQLLTGSTGRLSGFDQIMAGPNRLDALCPECAFACDGAVDCKNEEDESECRECRKCMIDRVPMTCRDLVCSVLEYEATDAMLISDNELRSSSCVWLNATQKNTVTLFMAKPSIRSRVSIFVGADESGISTNRSPMEYHLS